MQGHASRPRKRPTSSERWRSGSWRNQAGQHQGVQSTAATRNAERGGGPSQPEPGRAINRRGARSAREKGAPAGKADGASPNITTRQGHAVGTHSFPGWQNGASPGATRQCEAEQERIHYLGGRPGRTQRPKATAGAARAARERDRRDEAGGRTRRAKRQRAGCKGRALTWLRQGRAAEAQCQAGTDHPEGGYNSKLRAWCNRKQLQMARCVLAPMASRCPTPITIARHETHGLVHEVARLCIAAWQACVGGHQGSKQQRQ